MSEDKVSLSSQVVQQGDQEFTVPAATVPLPSQGVVYPVGSPLHLRQTIEIKPMTAREEDILTSRALLKSGKALDALLKSCVLTNNVNVDSMLSGDRNAILVAIRITGYGQAYTVSVDCPKCEASCEHEFNLAELQVKHLGAQPVQAGVNAFSFHLPVSKKNVTFKLLTGADENDLSVTIDRMKKLSGGMESLITTRLISQIVSVDGETDRNKIANLVRNMPARDSRDLRSYMDKISPGIDMNQNFICASCGEESSVEVPMGTEFFWPKS